MTPAPPNRDPTQRLHGPNPSTGAERVASLLIVDDEQPVLKALSRLLGREYDVLALSSPGEALGRISSGETWDFILTDVMMPEMTGIEFVRRATELWPSIATRIAFVTGGASTPGTQRALEQTSLPILSKPVEPQALREFLRRMLAERNAHST
jgi:CheY-like chemotaxis protein